MSVSDTCHLPITISAFNLPPSDIKHSDLSERVHDIDRQEIDGQNIDSQNFDSKESKLAKDNTSELSNNFKSLQLPDSSASSLMTGPVCLDLNELPASPGVVKELKIGKKISFLKRKYLKNKILEEKSCHVERVNFGSMCEAYWVWG